MPIRTLLCFAQLLAVFLGTCGQIRGQSEAPTHFTPDRGSTAPDVGIRSNPPRLTALVNAHVVVDSQLEYESGSVLMDGNRIVAVGDAVTLPPGTEIVDCDGDYLYPAFIDALVEFDSREHQSLSGYWNQYVTPERLMSRCIQVDDERLEELRKAGIGIVLAAPNNGIIKGQSCVMTTGNSSLSASLLRDAQFQHVRLYPPRESRDIYPNSPMGATALVRQALSDADWYRRAMQASDAMPELSAPHHNESLQNLLASATGEQTVLIDGTNELYALRADRLAREFGLRLVVRGSGREYRRLDAIAQTGRTFIVPVDFPKAPKVDTPARVADTSLSELMHWQLAPENPGRLEQAQVDFVLTSDGLDSPDELLDNVRTAVAHGLSPSAALEALTTRPAKLLEVEAIAGTLARGKLANILRLSGPLFDEQSDLIETWVAGQPSQLQAPLDRDPRGIWDVVVDSYESSFALEIRGETDELKAQFQLPPSKPNNEKDEEEDAEFVEFTSVEVTPFRVTGAFPVDDLLTDQLGSAGLTAVWIDAKPLQMRGHIYLPDGSKLGFDSVWVQEAAPAEDTKSEDNEESSGQESELSISINYPLGAYGRNEPPEQHEWVLFENATVWTAAEQGILQSADVLVHQGIISAVGIDLKAPDKALVVDATGMHITPGLIDCHSHMATDGGVNESAQAVTAEVRIGDFIDPNDIAIYRQLAGGVTTSNILHGSANPIGGQNQVIKLRWGSLGDEMKMAEAPAGIKFALGENVKQSNRGDEYTTRYPQTRMGVEQIMRDRFEAARLYQQKWKAWSTHPIGLPPRRDYELQAIAEILEGTRWIHCHSYRQDEILTMLRTLEDYDVTIGSLQHILEGYKVADAMAQHGAMGSSFSDWWAYKFEVFDAIPHNGAVMHRAGVVVSFNSDDSELARHLNHEAAKAVKYGGVPETEALKFVTLNPARQLRIEQWTGSLEPGKHADLVLWNRSPLSTMSMCMQTWIDGKKYFDRHQDVERRVADAALHRQLVQHVVQSGAKSGDADDDDPSGWWARYDEFCHHGHEGAHDDDE